LLAWVTKDRHIEIATYDGTAWSPIDSLYCDYVDTVLPDMHSSDGLDMSRDGLEYPVIGWNAFDGRTGVAGICVCIPSEDGYGRAEEIRAPGDKGGFSVARDRNGDVWVAWSIFRSIGPLHWVHTYTSAVCTPPTVTEDGGALDVAWSLSEPAPGSWWAVLRAVGEGAFESVARVQAGEGLEMSWVDEEAPTGQLIRYRIRRECVDTRYQWLSEASDAPVPTLLSLVGVEAKPGEVKLRWFSATDLGATAVQRRTAESEWTLLGEPQNMGNGLLTYVDSGVPSGRYAYRLGGRDGTEEVFSEATWVTVPSGSVLSLAGFQPNPSRGGAVVSFSLASAESATLEVVDVRGRVVLQRDVGSLGPGSHTVEIGAEAGLRPGVYWVRLKQGAETLTKRGVVLP
jgi:hypothetical protein